MNKEDDDFSVKKFLEGEDIFVPSTNNSGDNLKGRFKYEDNEYVYVEMDNQYLVKYDKEETYELNGLKDELYGEEGVSGGE